MRKSKLNRRDVLRGLGSIAIGLPWLEAFVSAPAQAQSSTAAKYFVSVFQPGGTVLDKWRPSGTEAAFTLSPILQPLESVKGDLVIVSGVDMKSAIGEQHQAGIVALLTGTPQSGKHGQYAAGPSVDQVIAEIASAGKPRKSIELAIRWATGKSHGNLSPINSLNFANDANFSPLSPRLDPVEVWDSLFGTLQPDVAGATNDMLTRKQSILDFLDKRYTTVAASLGARDRAKLDEHLTQIRQLEQTLTTVSTDTTTCTAPDEVNTSSYNPQSGKGASDDGSNPDRSSDAAIPLVGKYFMDMLVMALSCDMTGVATLQWSDTEAKHTFPWLDLSEHHHYYQHDGGFKPAECEKVATWYSEQHSYLISKLAQVSLGERSLLDDTIVFFGSELQDPPSHKKNSMPFMLAGRGGGLQSGRYLEYAGASHNDLLVSLLNLFGDPRSSFGANQYCTGPLPGLV